MHLKILSPQPVKMLRHLICCSLLCTFAPALALAQQASNNCEPSPAVKAALKKVAEIDNGKLSAKAVREQTLEQGRALLKQYPDDLFVHLRYQSARLRYLNVYNDPQHREPELLMAEYRARMEKHSDDPVSLYLYGSLLIGTRTKEAIGILEKALKQAPNFAQAYQSLFYIYQSPTYLDKAKAQENLKQSLATCPNTRSSYDPLFGQQVDDPEILRSGAQKLRALLEKSTDPDDLWYYGSLWKLEARLKPASEQAQVQEKVAADLQRLRAMSAAQTENLLRVLRDGYKQAGDKEGEQWAIEELLHRFPASRTAAFLTYERWRAEHPYPTSKDGPEKMQAYYEAKFNASEQWVRQWPNALSWWHEWFDSMNHLPRITDAEFDKITDGFLHALDQNAGSYAGPEPLSTLIAEAYLKRNLHFDRIQKLAEQGINEQEWSAHRYLQLDSWTAKQKEGTIAHLKYVREKSWPLLLEADLRLNQPNKAREVLGQMATALAQEKPSEAANQNDRFAYAEKVGYAVKQATYWYWMGRLAEHEQRKLDALICYQTALTFPMQERRDEKTNELTEKTRKLWLSLGGTDDGWKAWLALAEASEDAKEAPTEFAWKPKNKQLPYFTITDLQGRNWQPSDLKGKVVFINFWATWCAPCQKELPYVQKLSEQMKDRNDVMVLTFNVDSDLRLIEPFMKENKYTFTVLPAFSYVPGFNYVGMLSGNPIPCNWVVSADGICQMEQIGFGDESGAKWMRQAVGAIEKARGGK